MSFLGTRNAVSIGVSQHVTMGGPNLLNKLSPSLLLTFAGAQTLDPRITFTRATTATFTGSDGLIQTAAINAPRFDYSPTTLAPLGLLIEEQRTNLLTYSEQFDNAAWTKTNSTVTANTIVAPDGTLTGDKHIPDSGATIGAGATATRVYQSPSLTSGTAYTLSIYAKAGEYDELELAVITSPIVSATFSLTLGTVVSGTGTTITAVGNGWYRCTLTFTATSTGAIQIRWSSGSSTVSTGDGYSGIYIWGAQLEAGAFPTSYIPTVASQVTRSADVAVMTGTNFSDWYNATEGTLYAEAARNGFVAFSTISSISDGTANNGIFMSSGSAPPETIRLNVNVAGVQQALLNFGSVSAGVFYKTAGAYKTNDFAGSMNGASVLTDTSGTIPLVDRLTIGCGATASSQFANGTIRKIAYYPVRIQNAQLQGLTS